jgi:hypothetical protein
MTADQSEKSSEYNQIKDAIQYRNNNRWELTDTETLLMTLKKNYYLN